MLRKLYYTPEIMKASIVGAVIVLLLFIYEGIKNGGMEASSILVQSIIITLIYFIILFIAFYLLINLFYDYLKNKFKSTTIATIIILVIANSVLMMGLYVDASYSPMEVILTNLGLFLGINISVIFFGLKKS